MSEERMSVEEVLRQEGLYISEVHGGSMRPTLYGGRDSVTVIPKKSRLKKYDVALCRVGKKLILHRVIGLTDSGYITCGDSHRQGENVREDEVIGVMSEFVRNGRSVSVSSLTYRIYSRIYVKFKPFFFLFRKTKG